MQKEPFLLFFFSNLLMRRGREGGLLLIAAVTTRPPSPPQSGGEELSREGGGEARGSASRAGRPKQGPTLSFPRQRRFPAGVGGPAAPQGAPEATCAAPGKL